MPIDYAKLLTTENLTKISEFTSIKQVATVIKQTPAAGTPVVAGMTIEIQATSLSDVPWSVLDVTAPAAFREVPIADLQRAFEEDEVLKNVLAKPDLTDNDRIAITNSLNTKLATKGLSGVASTTDAATLVQSVKGLGFSLR